MHAQPLSPEMQVCCITNVGLKSSGCMAPSQLVLHNSMVSYNAILTYKSTDYSMAMNVAQGMQLMCNAGYMIVQCNAYARSREIPRL